MKKILKKIMAFILIFSIFFSNSIFAFGTDNNSTDVVCLKMDYQNSQKNNGIYLTEEYIIDGKFYRYEHKEENGFNIIKISGTENITIKAPIKNNRDIFSFSYKMANSDDWNYFSEIENYELFYMSVTQAVLAGALAGVCGGPVGAFLGEASVLLGMQASGYMNLKIIIGGKWRTVGSSIEYRRYAKLYDKSGRYIDTVHWSGGR